MNAERLNARATVRTQTASRQTPLHGPGPLKNGGDICNTRSWFYLQLCKHCARATGSTCSCANIATRATGSTCSCANIAHAQLALPAAVQTLRHAQLALPAAVQTLRTRNWYYLQSVLPAAGSTWFYLVLPAAGATGSTCSCGPVGLLCGADTRCVWGGCGGSRSCGCRGRGRGCRGPGGGSWALSKGIVTKAAPRQVLLGSLLGGGSCRGWAGAC